MKARTDRLAKQTEESRGGRGSVAHVVISRSCMEHIYLRVCLPSIRSHCSSGAPHCGWLFLNLECFALCYAFSQLRMFCFVLCPRRQKPEALQEQRWPKGCVPALADLQETHEVSFACRPNSISYIKKCAFNPLLK